ncbi:hypothetical protein SynMITS9220_00240 [Synechococcus sp. MIT S9220]|nr:hypothetical protein SynMITS9220_00240 [Synechococcus sp. MIT S9220]
MLGEKIYSTDILWVISSEGASNTPGFSTIFVNSSLVQCLT